MATKIPHWHKIHHNIKWLNVKYTKILNGRKMHQNVPTQGLPKNTKNWHYWYGNVPSGSLPFKAILIHKSNDYSPLTS
jgi:hypothetical protein